MGYVRHEYLDRKEGATPVIRHVHSKPAAVYSHNIAATQQYAITPNAMLVTVWHVFWGNVIPHINTLYGTCHSDGNQNHAATATPRLIMPIQLVDNNDGPNRIVKQSTFINLGTNERDMDAL